MSLLLLLLLGHALGVLWRQTAADGTGLLRAEVEWQVLLLLVEDSELRSLVDVDDGEDTGNRLANVVAAEFCQSIFLPRKRLSFNPVIRTSC